MVQFNLLPDVKIQYLRARRQKRLVVLTSTIAIIASLAILVLLIVVVQVLQKKNLSDLNRDIGIAQKELEDTKDLNKILTVQNQLTSLPGLYSQKTVTSRLFGIMTQVTPNDTTIAKLLMDFDQNKMTVTGSTDSLTTVNKFVDTLKFTKFEEKKAGLKDQAAFSEVVLSSFGRDSKGATYTLSLKFDPTIFKEDVDVVLTVPKIISTRSQVEQPGVLFEQPQGGS